MRIKSDIYDEARRAIRDRLAEVGFHLTLIFLFWFLIHCLPIILRIVFNAILLMISRS